MSVINSRLFTNQPLNVRICWSNEFSLRRINQVTILLKKFFVSLGSKFWTEFINGGSFFTSIAILIRSKFSFVASVLVLDFSTVTSALLGVKPSVSSWNAIRWIELIEPPPLLVSTIQSKLFTQKNVTTWSLSVKGFRERHDVSSDFIKAAWAWAVSISQTLL